MSLVTNRALYDFLHWLHGWQPDAEIRPGIFTQEDLAEKIMTNRAHLSQVLTGKRSGVHTWRRLVKVLPEEGLSLLRHCSSWNKYAEAALQRRLRDAQFSERFSQIEKTKERIPA